MISCQAETWALCAKSPAQKGLLCHCNVTDAQRVRVQFRCAVCLVLMSYHIIPKSVLYSTLQHGARPRDCQINASETTRRRSIDNSSSESSAVSRTRWRPQSSDLIVSPEIKHSMTIRETGTRQGRHLPPTAPHRLEHYEQCQCVETTLESQDRLFTTHTSSDSDQRLICLSRRQLHHHYHHHFAINQ